MAIQVERLIATLEANFNKYDKALNRALGNTDRTFGRIERRGKQMEARLAQVGTKLSSTYAKIFAGVAATRGAQALVDAATRIDNALKIAGLSGEELNKVYGRLRDSALRNAAPLESLVELYGRAALVQKELGVTGEELLGFTDNIAVALRVSGKSASEASGALLQLSQALGSGVVRAEEFNSILEGALPIAQAAAAGLEEAGGSVARLRQLVVDGKVSSEAFFRAFEAGAPILQQKVAGATLTISQRMTNLKTALVDAAREFNNSTQAGETFGAEIDRLTQFINALDFDNLISQLRAVSADLRDGAAAAREFFLELGRMSGLENVGSLLTGGTGRAEFLGGALTVTSSKGIEDRINAAFAHQIETSGRLTAEAIRNSVLGSGAATMPKTGRLAASGAISPVSLADFGAPASTGGSAAKAAKAATDAWKGLRKATVDTTAATAAAQAQYEELGRVAQTALGGLVSALQDGKLEGQELLQILGQVVTQLLSMPSLGGGGILGGIFGALFHKGGVVGEGGPTRRVHPAVFAGAPRYHRGGVAGLRPGEVPAILQRGEVVLPKGGKVGVPQQQAVRVIIETVDPMFTARVEQISGPVAQQTTAKGLQAYDRGKERQRMTGG